MNIRGHKGYRMAQIAYNMLPAWVGYQDPTLCKAVDFLNHDPAGMANVFRESGIEEARQEFVCVKVSDGTVIDTFDTYEDALVLVNKHIKGKKAKLQILDSITGAVIETV